MTGGREQGERVAFWLVLAMSLVCLGVLAWPMLTGRIYIEEDFSAFHLPVRHFYWDCLQRGEDPSWMPSQYCGFYLHGEGQAGMLHPVHQILYRTLPFDAAFNLDFLWAYPLAFAGMYLFLRRSLRVSRFAAAAGALLFAFSGTCVTNYMYIMMVAVLAHVPWALFCIDCIARRRSAGTRWAVIGLALITASQFMLGFPQAFLFSLLCEGAYILYRFPWSGSGWVRGLMLVAAGKAVGTMLGAVQWLPTIVTASESFRSAPAFEFQMHNSLHPFCLLTYISPYLFHRHGGMDAPYAGVLAPVCLLWLVWRWKHLSRGWRVLCACAIALGLFALLVAMGRHSAFAQWWVQLPMVGKFRFPSRYTFIFHLASVVLTALALCDIQRMRNSGVLQSMRLKMLLLLPATFSGLIAILALSKGQWIYDNGLKVFPNFFFYAPQCAPTPHILMGPVLMLGAAFAIYLAVRIPHGWGLSLCVLLIGADLGLYGLRHKPMTSFEAFKAAVEMPPSHEGYRIDPDCLPVSAYTCPTLYGARVPQGFVALMPVNALDYYGQETALRLAGVKWRKARPCDLPPLTDAALRGEKWVAVRDPMPRARLVGKVQESADPRRDVEQIDIQFTALLDPGPLPALSPWPPGKAQVLEDRPGIIRIKVNPMGTALLVVNERWFKGWTAYTKAGETVPLRVYGDFMGVTVEGEEQEVLLKFSSKAQQTGGYVSLLGLIMLPFLWGFTARPRRFEGGKA